jgi:predicted RecA/RadA family phage recombinase
MAKNYVCSGDSLPLAVPYAAGVTAGQGMLVGTFLFGVALSDGAQNDIVTASLTGVWDLTKEPSLVVAAGDKLWWDNTNRRVTKTNTSNVPIGIAAQAELAGSTTVRVLLQRTPAAAA